jgi:hypothetical protein
MDPEPIGIAAASGAFGISPNAGEALLNAIHHCQDSLETATGDVDRIRQETRLGTSPDALVMTKFNKDVADGGTNSAVIALTGLRDILTQAEVSVSEAMTNYRRTDEQNAGTIDRAES